MEINTLKGIKQPKGCKEKVLKELNKEGVFPSEYQFEWITDLTLAEVRKEVECYLGCIDNCGKCRLCMERKELLNKIGGEDD